jgi:hypothetical protein
LGTIFEVGRGHGFRMAAAPIETEILFSSLAFAKLKKDWSE